MRKSSSQLLLITLAAILIFTSCSKTNTEGRYIPNGVAFVFHFNGKSLSSKLPWSEIKESELFKVAYADSATPAFMKSVLEHPENSGIDVENDILIFALKDATGSYVAAEGTLKDEAKFRQFNKEAAKNSAVESDEDGIHFSNTPNMTSSWNKDRFVLVMDASGVSMDPIRRMRDRSGYPSTVPSSPVKKDMVPVAKQIFGLKEDNSLGKDEKFTELMKSGGDVHFWMNSEALAKGGMGDAAGALSMVNIDKLYEGSRITGTINFDNGKIKADFKSYSGKEMTALMDKYSGDKLNTEMLKRLPSKNLAGMFILNFKPEGIREYLKLLGVEGFVNMAAPRLGFNLDDFIKANKGDIMLAATDLIRDSSGRPNANVLFSASIADHASFDKLVNAGKKMVDEKLGPKAQSFISYRMNEKYFAIGNKKENVDQYISESGNNSFDFMDKISGGAGAAYINFQYILKNSGMDMKKDSIRVAMYDASVKMWDNLIAYGGGNNTQHIEINLVDKTTNSLKQLHNYIGTMGLLMKKQEMLYRNTPIEPDMIDTTKAPSTY